MCRLITSDSFQWNLNRNFRLSSFALEYEELNNIVENLIKDIINLKIDISYNNLINTLNNELENMINNIKLDIIRKDLILEEYEYLILIIIKNINEILLENMFQKLI